MRTFPRRINTSLPISPSLRGGGGWEGPSRRSQGAERPGPGQGAGEGATVGVGWSGMSHGDRKPMKGCACLCTPGPVSRQGRLLTSYSMFSSDPRPHSTNQPQPQCSPEDPTVATLPTWRSGPRGGARFWGSLQQPRPGDHQSPTLCGPTQSMPGPRHSQRAGGTCSP